MAAKRKSPTEPERLKRKIAMGHERLRVCEEAGRSVSDLIRLAADGNRLVAYTVFMLAGQLVDGLGSIVKVRPKLGRWLARDTFMWPAFISRKRPLKQANEKLLNTLQLGKGETFSDREWHLGAPSIQAAMKLFIAGHWRTEARRGPRLSRKNKKQWFDDNWNEIFGDDFPPEQIHLLRKLGASKARKKPKYCKHLHPATQLANVRSEIKARVWQAFDKMFYPGK
jgi:hypothetical protein